MGRYGYSIDFADITSVQYKAPDSFVGYIQISYPGSIESKGGAYDALHDENTIPVEPSMANSAAEVAAFIEQRRKESQSENKGTMIHQVSAADALKKFKELLDMNIISQEEFDAKKEAAIRYLINRTCLHKMPRQLFGIFAPYLCPNSLKYIQYSCVVRALIRHKSARKSARVPCEDRFLFWGCMCANCSAERRPRRYPLYIAIILRISAEQGVPHMFRTGA